MTRLTNLETLRIGDKVLQVEQNQGLNGQIERVYANLVTVIKCTESRVYFSDDVYNDVHFAIRKDTYSPDREFYYGIKTDYYLPIAEQLQSGNPMLPPV